MNNTHCKTCGEKLVEEAGKSYVPTYGTVQANLVCGNRNFNDSRKPCPENHSRQRQGESVGKPGSNYLQHRPFIGLKAAYEARFGPLRPEKKPGTTRNGYHTAVAA